MKLCPFKFNFLCLGFVIFLVALVDVLKANPSGEMLVSGDATFYREGNTLTINQFSDQAVIHWDSFSIENGEVTLFNQPHAGALSINRVLSDTPSLIYGMLKANGEIILINPAGIIVGPSGQIDTAAFTASTLDLNLDHLMETGNRRFAGTSQASIINQGKIQALDGDIYLLASQITNTGEIRAPEGTVGLGAASDILLQSAQNPQGIIQIQSQPGANNQSITNQGTIQAALVELKASGGNHYALAINNEGQIHASGVRHTHDGRVLLVAEEGDIHHAGHIQAQKASGQGGEIKIKATQGRTTLQGSLEANGTEGGQIHVLGDKVILKNGTSVNAQGQQRGGEILVGGDWQGKNPDVPNAKRTLVESGATLAVDALENGNGGKAVVWADEATSFQGAITARGGLFGGDGGDVEVSGKQFLDYRGMVDTRAPAGQVGRLLLDPSDIHITASINLDILLSGNSFIDGPLPISPSQLSASTLVTALASSDIIVTTTSTETDLGDITVFSPITWTSPHSLTLHADRSIIINAAITAPNGNLILQAGVSNPVGAISNNTIGSIFVNQIQANAQGTISFLAPVISNLSATFNAGVGFSNILFSAPINVTGPGQALVIQSTMAALGALTAGSITVHADQGISLNNSVTSTDSSITIHADWDSNGVGNIMMNPGSSINAATGQPITLTGADILMSSFTPINGTDILHIMPSVAGTPIHIIGSGTGMTISPLELFNISTTFSEIIIGNNNSGPIHSSLVGFPHPNITLIGSSIQQNSPLTLTNQTLSFNATNGNIHFLPLSSLNASSAANLTLNASNNLILDGPFSFTGNSILSANIGNDVIQNQNITLTQSTANINNGGFYTMTGNITLGTNALFTTNSSADFLLNGTLTSVGNSQAIIQSNDIFLNGTGLANNGFITLVANQNFINLQGPNALTATGAGQWLVYAFDEATSFTNGLIGDWLPEYGLSYPSPPSLSGSGFIYVLGGVIYDFSYLFDLWDDYLFHQYRLGSLFAMAYDAEGVFIFEDSIGDYAINGISYSLTDKNNTHTLEVSMNQGVLFFQNILTGTSMKELPISVRENLFEKKRSQLQEAIDTYKTLPPAPVAEQESLLPNQALQIQSGSINRIAFQTLPQTTLQALSPSTRSILEQAITQSLRASRNE